jgi:hypothetical protein
MGGLLSQAGPLQNAEPVLLVHDHEPEATEGHIRLQERMRPYGNTRGRARQQSQRLAPQGRRAAAG